MNEKTNKTKQTEAYYNVLIDAYKQKYKLRTYFLEKFLFHMLEKIQEETTIFYLMQMIQEHRRVQK